MNDIPSVSDESVGVKSRPQRHFYSIARSIHAPSEAIVRAKHNFLYSAKLKNNGLNEYITARMNMHLHLYRSQVVGTVRPHAAHPKMLALVIYAEISNGVIVESLIYPS